MIWNVISINLSMQQTLSSNTNQKLSKSSCNVHVLRMMYYVLKEKIISLKKMRINTIKM